MVPADSRCYDHHQAEVNVAGRRREHLPEFVGSIHFFPVNQVPTRQVDTGGQHQQKEKIQQQAVGAPMKSGQGNYCKGQGHKGQFHAQAVDQPAEVF